MDPNQITFIDVLRWTEDKCRAFLESQRWPDGPRCPKCGDADPWKITRRSKTKNGVTSLYRCRGCKRQYTATVGTIFEDSKIPLSKWFAAIFLMCGSKKGISAHQIHRELGITYKSAWYMCHRIREAMADGSPTPLSGVVEADETYVGRKTQRGHRVWRERIRDEEEMALRDPKKRTDYRKSKAIVFGMLERGGRVRTAHVREAIASELRPILLENDEFEFSFNRRKVSDAERFALLMRQVQGRILWYCRTPQPENPYA